MKAFAWMALGVSVGAAAYLILNQPGPMQPTGDPDVEEAAGQVGLWGSKQRLRGKARGAVGYVKEGIGQALGDDELAGQGLAQKAVGAVQDTVGKVAQGASQAIHDLNQ
jgi:uncharacterized protein YjbJ (UPF0337 family)